VDSRPIWVVPLAQASLLGTPSVGGKAAKLSDLINAGFRVPAGFCITSSAYEHYIDHSDLVRLIRMELGRKPFRDMRWEEIWDAALRIRSAFLSTDVPNALAREIGAAVDALGAKTFVAVRSSAPGEDAADRSFAGLHESVVGVRGVTAALDAVRVVWASLWSDAALLCRQELSLDPSHSRMAVVVQELVTEDRSGVAFGRDPRDPTLECAIVEAVPGLCSDLVDGLVDPDHWTIDRTTGDILKFRAGEREGADDSHPLLEPADLSTVLEALQRVELLFGWPPDTEWTGRQERFMLLQARPITTAANPTGDERGWYLSLRPSQRRLAALAERVSQQLIPQLAQLGNQLAGEAIEAYTDAELAAAVEARLSAYREWQHIYRDEFIPFAHGVRQLGTYSITTQSVPSTPTNLLGS